MKWIGISRVRFAVLSGTLAVLGTSACKPPDQEPPVPELHTIELAATKTTLMVNEAVQVTASAKDQFGNPFPVPALVWSSGDQSRLAVDPQGNVTGRSAGTGTVTASGGNNTASIQLTVAGALHHNRTISASETWRAADNPHVIRGDVKVEGSSSPELTIEAGVLARFETNAGLWIGWAGGGSLQVNGTQASGVTFTSAAATPGAGQWSGIHFSDYAAPSQLTHAVLEYCGASAYYGTSCLSMFGNGSTGFTVGTTNVTVRNGTGTGVALGGNARFASGSAGLTVENMSGVPVSIQPEHAGTLPSAATFSANATNVIRVGSGTVQSTQTWANHGVPYLVSEDVLVEGTATPVLTLPAGTQLRFAAGKELTVGWAAGGALVAAGTANEPVVLTAHSATPTAGHWKGLTFSHLATSASSLTHTTIEYCGANSYYGNGCLFVHGGGSTTLSVAVADVVLRHGSGDGANLGSGGNFATGSARVTVQNVARYPFMIQPDHAGSLPTGGTFSGNSVGMIALRSGDVTKTQTWPNLGMPYMIDHEFNVGSTAGPLLTLLPGTQLRFTTQGALLVGWTGNGGIDARGTAEAPIVFTANASSPAAGHWKGITLHDNSGSQFDHITVEYAGRNFYYGGANVIFASDFGPILTNSVIRHSSGCGVLRAAWSGTWSTDFTAPQHGNTFAGNTAADQCGP